MKLQLSERFLDENIPLWNIKIDHFRQLFVICILCKPWLLPRWVPATWFLDFFRLTLLGKKLVKGSLSFFRVLIINLTVLFWFLVIIPLSQSCWVLAPHTYLPSFEVRSTRRSSDGGDGIFPKSVTRINSPGQRFTSTHGIDAKVSFIYRDAHIF